ncbi:peptide chain release factor N(5)-glutamine methyltransferase [Candidatus Pelagibacter sp.]|nr:peptide chain release factor N(5)-glutamine methyltransferase [Candidatus Pelagibacter sp.]
MNIQTAINIASRKLKAKDFLTPLLDCELIMSKVIDKEREFLILNSDLKLRNRESAQFNKLINERLSGKPIAYLTGKKYFWNYEFKINENVLIPRPDTELLVEEVLKVYKSKEKINFLEVGIGSGCISLSILKEKKNFFATGIDISNYCINACEINARDLDVKSRIKLFKSDIDNFNKGKYDLVISNPPYIKKLDLQYLEKDILNFEPKIALDGGLDGTSEIRKLIKKTSELIKTNGKLIFEIAFDQTKKVKSILNDHGFYINAVVKDLAKNDRCIISTKK